MPLALPRSLPATPLLDLAGHSASLATTLGPGPGIFLLGHRNCKTTRQTLPYLERLHQRAVGTVVAVLQDLPDEAREQADEQGLSLPILCEPDPYELAGALELSVVPTIFLVIAGRIEALTQAFHKGDLDAFAGRLGATESLFAADDPMPATKPG